MSRKPLRDLSHEQYLARLRPLINRYANEINQQNHNEEVNNINLENHIENVGHNDVQIENHVDQSFCL